jgi:hypothetical protein
MFVIDFLTEPFVRCGTNQKILKLRQTTLIAYHYGLNTRLILLTGHQGFVFLYLMLTRRCVTHTSFISSHCTKVIFMLLHVSAACFYYQLPTDNTLRSSLCY